MDVEANKHDDPNSGYSRTAVYDLHWSSEHNARLDVFNVDALIARAMGQTLSIPVTNKYNESGEDDRFLYGVSEMQGWRITMEDAHTIALRLDDDEQTNSFFAVYDGHGGGAVSKFAGQNVHKRLVKEEAYQERKYAEAMKRAFLGTDEDMLADPSFIREPSGCTAVAALVTKDNQVYVANAGDSRVVMSINGTVEPLSYDHKPQNELERERIHGAGGYVEYGRVNGNLALARALGDFEYKKNYSIPPERQVITANPEVITHDIAEVDEFIVLACDGIWDCLSSQQVVNIVRLQVSQGKSLPEICDNLCDLCLAPDTVGAGYGCDNMTVMIVALLQGQTREQWYAKIKDRVERKVGFDTPDTLPELYSPKRLVAFKTKMQAWAAHEKQRLEREQERQRQRGSSSDDYIGSSPEPSVISYTIVASDEVSYHAGAGISSDSMLSQDDSSDTDDIGDDDSPDDDTLFSRRSDAPDMTKSLKEQLEELEKDETDSGERDADGDLKIEDADEEAFREPFDSVIDLSQAERHRAEARANGSSTSQSLPSTTPDSSPRTLQGETPPPPQPLPNGFATTVPGQLHSLPGGDEPDPSVKAEGFLDSSEDPLKG
ncbi:hypothetical protein EW146_g7785 [Bondarzewia mesenterica]|uniref:protein-serine/threonine phosphatase n=1 Tax=Bondarzewia mesenterica TaxID=1095465 RepID=A0A4S4LJH0_9AGAM|nr:hypothetical protein EW146_g7785 [Bondarzewia mesenterica]